MFLQGPARQFRNMTDKTRLGTSITYVVMMILTLVMALKVKTMIGTIICCVLQWIALIWCGGAPAPRGNCACSVAAEACAAGRALRPRPFRARPRRRYGLSYIPFARAFVQKAVGLG